MVLIHSSIEQMIVEVGVDKELFNKHFHISGKLSTECWIKHTWEFINKHRMDIQDDIQRMELLHEKDCFIIPAILNTLRDGSWSMAELCTVN